MFSHAWDHARDPENPTHRNAQSCGDAEIADGYEREGSLARVFERVRWLPTGRKSELKILRCSERKLTTPIGRDTVMIIELGRAECDYLEVLRSRRDGQRGENGSKARGETKPPRQR